MIHHDSVVEQAVRVLSDIIRDQEAEVYLVQNIYGRLVIYLDTKNRSLVDTATKRLSDELGSWFQSCNSYDVNLLIKNEIELQKNTALQIQDHIWLFEKFITNIYWPGQHRKKMNSDKKPKLVSFYSYRGGVGRTTAMIMSAISLARRGKRVLLIDFDLESPGVAGFFPQEYLPKYGLLDFLVDHNVPQEKEDQFPISEYIYSVSDLCQVTSGGGEIFVMPVYGSVLKEHPELYLKSLMRCDFDLPMYFGDQTTIDSLLLKISEEHAPDIIFIDAHSGISQTGGIILSRYSDLATLFFCGDQQNNDGMKIVLPHLKKSVIPFVLVNEKVSSDSKIGKSRKDSFAKEAYEILCTCDSEYRDGRVSLNDTSAEHFPLSISYNSSAEVLQNTDQLLKAYENQNKEYQLVADTIWDAVSSK